MRKKRAAGSFGEGGVVRHSSVRENVRMRNVARVVAVAALCAGLAACGPTAPAPSGSPSPTVLPSPSPTATSTPVVPLEPTGGVRDLATGLDAPWSVVALDGGSALISERDTARIIELNPGGDTRVAGTIGGVRHGGEGGLLGIEVVTISGAPWLYAYHTASGDNRVIRMPLEGEPGSLALGAPEVVLSGIPRAGNHNGGRIKLGPDGHLYVTTGDAGNPSLSQDPASLAGKILRMTLDGAAPSDNPTPGSLVFSVGHRNPQGIAWDSTGQLWSAEFGQNTWDELNIIVPGGNYGWPKVEGTGGGEQYRDPVAVWSTAEASPSGLGIVGDTKFLAALRGQRLWVVYADHDGAGTATGSVEAVDWFVGEFGRMRDAVAIGDDTLWVLTNNTDGRGSPGSGDDRLFEVELTERG